MGVVLVEQLPFGVIDVDLVIVVALRQREGDAAVFEDRQHIVRRGERVFHGLVRVPEDGNALPDPEIILEIARAGIFHEIAGEDDQIGLCRLDRFFKEGFQLVRGVLVVLRVGQVQNRERPVVAKAQRGRIVRGKAGHRADRQEQQAQTEGERLFRTFHAWPPVAKIAICFFAFS